MQDVYRDLIASYPEAFSATIQIRMDKGWVDLLREIALKYIERGVKINEAYVKIGSLRIEPIISEVLEGELKIYHRSMATCEDCGQPGRVRNIQGYCRATCDAHELEWAAYMKRMYR